MKRNLASQLVVFGFAAAAFFVPLAFGSHGFATKSVRSSGGPTVQQAYQQLLSTKFFAFGGVGFAGTTSDGERAFNAIAASTNALELFTAALTQGNTQARLYALCGIRRLAPERFDVLAKPVVVANPKVSTMAGCVGTDDQASNVVAHIAGGWYDFHIGIKQKRPIPATNVLSQKMPATPPPGVYQATPYSGIVVVPEPVDSLAVHVPTSTNQFTIRSIKPSLHLIPKK